MWNYLLTTPPPEGGSGKIPCRVYVSGHTPLTDSHVYRAFFVNSRKYMAHARESLSNDWAPCMAGLPVLRKVYLDIRCSKQSDFIASAVELLMRRQA